MTRNQWKGLLAAGAAAAAILLPISEQQTADVIAYNNNMVTMQRSSVQILPNLDNSSITAVAELQESSPAQTGVAIPPITSDAGSESQSNTSQNNGDQNTASTAAGSGSAAASGQKIRNGPSILTQITTQGELGNTRDAIFGGAKVTMLNSQNGQQILSCIIETSQGKLIVVDGGFGEDAGYLSNQIMARGGHVSAWLLTHPHGDHVGAIHAILDDHNRQITIGGIYYSLAEPEWYTSADAQDAEMAHALINTLRQQPAEMLHGDIGKGYEIMVDDVRIEVLNNRYDIAHDAGNNASMVYRITINGKTIVFLGDLGEEGGNRLVAEYGEGLKADIVQMAHHGQDGVGANVYQAINPTVCVWPTPQWLWDNNRGTGLNTGSWKITTTKSWMNQINGTIIHYVTKDGDQTIY